MVGVVCALMSFQRAVTKTRLPAGVSPATAKGDSDAPATEKLDAEHSSAEAERHGADDLIAQSAKPLESGDVSNPRDESRLAQAVVLAERPAVEATIVKEEENGRVVYQAADPDEPASRLRDTLQNHQNTASWDLLRMFQAELDSDAKADLLSAASVLPHDQNTRWLLQAALSSTQPAEIRAEAAAFAAEQNPDLLLSHLADSDPLVRMEIQNAFTVSEPPSQIVGGQRPAKVILPPSAHN